MAGQEPTGQLLGPALVSFTVDGQFPEEAVSALKITAEELPGAIKALRDAKSKLEEEIHIINTETADDVNTWFTNAKTLQDDINRSKQTANDIQRQAEEPVASGKTLQEAEGKAAFLVRELSYNQQLLETLRDIKAVSTTLDGVEQARGGRRILDALHLLEKSWKQLDALAVNNSCKAIKLLNLRAFELKSDVHDVFDHVWNALVHVDLEKCQLLVQQSREDEAMSLSDAVIGLKSYKEVDQRMARLWHDLDKAIIGARMNIRSASVPGIHVRDGLLQTKGESDKTLDSLFNDLEQVFAFLASTLPVDLVQAISSVMMPEVTNRLVSAWLDSAVPSTLAEMDRFEHMIRSASEFCRSLSSLNYSGFTELQEWVDNAPKVWLSKCRETALDSVRQKLSKGLGSPKQVEKIEKRMVSRSEGKELMTNGPSAATAGESQDWDAAWSDEGDHEDGDAPEARNPPSSAVPQDIETEDDGADAWGAWGGNDDDNEVSDSKPAEVKTEESTVVKADEEEDAVDAWGWGDDEGDGDHKPDPMPEPEQKPKVQPRSKEAISGHSNKSAATREMTLKETYSISSMPEPVLALIFAILEDGAALTDASHENSPVTAAAAGLFSVPTLVLAMFRAISPYYYSSQMGGNMFLYNDATYLAEKLGELAMSWKTRDDLTPRAQKMLRIDNDLKSLQSFANRAYSNEMNIQKTIVRDLLGGEQSVMQQSFIESAVAQVRSVAATWEEILPKSAWYQAVGALVDSAAAKVIGDVVEMPSISQDEAYNIANMIANVTELDDLFPPAAPSASTEGGEPNAPVPATAQYAPSWLRLKYLSEVLQSNLREVRYLWIESELSLYFTLDEVVDLINASFEDNARTREIIREIRHNPHPIQGQ